MYKLMVRVQAKNKGRETEKSFEIGPEESAEYKEQMNAVSDYLYDLDIPFDVDEDGDMLIDDILVAITEGEPLSEQFTIKNVSYTIRGEEA